MATLNDIKTYLGYTDNYHYEGRLFRDIRRDTATLYLTITDTTTGYTTPEIRVGFKHFESTDTQIQTETLLRESGESIQGLEVVIYVPQEDVVTYQLDFNLKGLRHTAHWYTERNKNLVATSESRPIPIETLFKPSVREALSRSNSKMQNFLNNINN